MLFLPGQMCMPPAWKGFQTQIFWHWSPGPVWLLYSVQRAKTSGWPHWQFPVEELRRLWSKALLLWMLFDLKKKSDAIWLSVNASHPFVYNGLLALKYWFLKAGFLQVFYKLSRMLLLWHQFYLLCTGSL